LDAELLGMDVFDHFDLVYIFRQIARQYLGQIFLII